MTDDAPGRGVVTVAGAPGPTRSGQSVRRRGSGPASRNGLGSGHPPAITRVNGGADDRGVVTESSARPSKRGGPRQAAGPRRRWMPPVSGERRLLGLTETATYLGVSPWTVRSLQWQGRLPRVDLGRRLLFDLRDLDALVDTAKQDPS